MNPLVKASWVAALRSGQYQQGRSHLRQGPEQKRHCCLGVFCELHSKTTGEQWIGDSYQGLSGQLPNAVLHWAGLTEEEQDRLITLNDRDRESFQQIAARVANDEILRSAK